MRTDQHLPARVLIAYGTNQGQTAKIAEYLADILRGDGCVADPVDLGRSPAPHLESYDAVIVGASVHMGKHQKCVRRFVRANRPMLDRLGLGFFSVSMAAREPSVAGRKEARRYLDEFARETGWQPARAATFAGALAFTKYGIFIRWMMKKIARSKGTLDLDTSRDYEYTDWQSVHRFAEEVLATLHPEESPELLEV